ncbi:MAG: D-alanine--D-alanine ligase [Desulfobulbaceae bacterium]|nr:D-alanine--D-alanine ligase [Desulfobulbaceae bacterium]
MKIIIVHNQVSSQDSADARDVLFQVEAVSGAMNNLGHQVETLACTLDLENMGRTLTEKRPDYVFNLVEDIAGQGRLIHLFPFLLDSLGIAYSGSAAESIFLTSHKIMAKERMIFSGLPTPDWRGPCPFRGPGRASGGCKGVGKWIVKSLWEHASVGLDSGSVLETDSFARLMGEMESRLVSLGGACFAEEFIDGREFNLSLLESDSGVEVLPPAEIVFEGYSKDMVRIVDYQAKWEDDSYGYHHTNRCFDFAEEDKGLLQNLIGLARKSWEVFALAGYARVDFRVDDSNRPYILEVNANPCLSPDAGFAAALSRAGLSFGQAVQRIISAGRVA